MRVRPQSLQSQLEAIFVEAEWPENLKFGLTQDFYRDLTNSYQGLMCHVQNV